MDFFLRKFHESFEHGTRFVVPPGKSEISTDLVESSHRPRTSPFTVIELFQSQGCNSCPPTNANLLSLSDPNVLFLTYHVTYWDHLGWADIFGNRAFDARQRDYVKRLGLRSAFTPQAIVNGRASGVGNFREGLERIIKEGRVEEHNSLQIEVALDDHDDSRAVVRVSGKEFVGKPGEREHKLDVWIVQYDPNMREVLIKSGENSGRVLPHRNVVRSVSLLGEADVGADSSWTIQRYRDGLSWVVLVQHGVGGPIVGASSPNLGISSEPS